MSTYTQQQMAGIEASKRLWNEHQLHYASADRRTAERTERMQRVSAPEYTPCKNAQFDIHVRDPVLGNLEDNVGELGDAPVGASFSDDSHRIMVICAGMVLLGGLVWLLRR